jgi:hypothetical protein
MGAFLFWFELYLISFVISKKESKYKRYENLY